MTEWIRVIDKEELINKEGPNLSYDSQLRQHRTGVVRVERESGGEKVVREKVVYSHFELLSRLGLTVREPFYKERVSLAKLNTGIVAVITIILKVFDHYRKTLK